MPQTTDSSPITWPQLRECIADCRPRLVIELLSPFLPAELKHLHAGVKALHTELRRLERTEYMAAYNQYASLMVAALMCAQTPVQAASWLTKPMLLHATWPYGRNGGSTNAPHATMLNLLLERRDPQWTGDLACRLASGLRADPDFTLWTYANALAEHGKATVPLTDGYVSGWMMEGSRKRYSREQETLLSWVRSEPRAREYVARVFEIAGLGAHFVDAYAARFGEDNEWPKVLTKLAADGVLDRAELLDGCLARLLRGDRLGSLRGHVKLYEQLAPTPAEVKERLATYLGVIASAPALSAKTAQRDVRALDAHEAVEPETLATLCADVFARTETGLIDQQCAWIDAALKRDPRQASLLLPTLVAAFAHPNASVQQRALKLVARHKDKAGSDVLAELRAAASQLDAAFRSEAARILAGGQESAAPDEPPAVVGLPPYQPTPMPPALDTLDDLVTAFAAPLADVYIEQLELERIMAAVADFAYRDRAALVAALTPLHERYPGKMIFGGVYNGFPRALRCLFDAVFGEDHRSGSNEYLTGFPLPTSAIVVRVYELANALLAGRPVPVLLATPTGSDGSLDPAVFSDRIKAYRDLDAQPLPCDLEQALFRVPGEVDLGFALPGPIPDFGEFYRGELIDIKNMMPLVRPLGLLSGGGPSLIQLRRDGGFTPYWIFVPPDKSERRAFTPSFEDTQADLWPTLLPHHPELLSAHAIPRLYQAADESRSARTPFPRLAETAGQPGPVTHLALVYGLAAHSPGDRVAAQDAALTLIARGLLQPELLGRLAGVVWHHELIKAPRLIASLSDIEQAGGAAVVFGITSAVIGVMAANPAARGLPDLLLLATRSATTAGIRGVTVAGLSTLSACAKPARMAQEARRLKEALEAPLFV